MLLTLMIHRAADDLLVVATIFLALVMMFPALNWPFIFTVVLIRFIFTINIIFILFALVLSHLRLLLIINLSLSKLRVVLKLIIIVILLVVVVNLFLGGTAMVSSRPAMLPTAPLIFAMLPASLLKLLDGMFVHFFDEHSAQVVHNLLLIFVIVQVTIGHFVHVRIEIALLIIDLSYLVVDFFFIFSLLIEMVQLVRNIIFLFFIIARLWVLLLVFRLII